VEIWASGQVVRGAIWPLSSIAIRSAFNSKALITEDKGDGDVRLSSVRCWPFSRMVRDIGIPFQASRWGEFRWFCVRLSPVSGYAEGCLALFSDV
jgi:hypothetical protein